MPERPNDGRTSEPTLEERWRCRLQAEAKRRDAALHAMSKAGAAADDLTSRIAEVRKREAAEAAELLADAIARRMPVPAVEQRPPQTPTSAPQLATIWFHGEGQYSIDRVTPFNVSEAFDNILQAFLASQAAMGTSDLQAKSGVTNVSRTMKDLTAWNGGVFKNAIRIPTGKSRGGYFVRVQPV